MFRGIFVFILLVFFTMGCTDLSTSSVKTVKPGSQPIKGVLLAKVDDWSIGTTDFRDKLEALKTLLPQDDLQKQIDDPETKKRILQELVNLEILAQAAEREGLDNDAEVRNAVREFKRNFLAQKLLGNLYKDITVTDVEIETFYNTNKLIFREPEERKIREIVIPNETQMKDVSIRILQGEDFSSLASSNSIADSRNKGGDLGYLKIDEQTTSSQKFPKFWQAALTTESGKTSSYFIGPDNRFYILKIEDIKGGKVKPLIEVRDRIREHLRGTQANKKREDMIFDARQKFNVVVNEELLD